MGTVSGLDASMNQKTIYIWQHESIEAGNPKKIAQRLVEARFEGAILHSVSVDSWRSATRVALVAALKEAGLAVYGGSAVYGVSPRAEGAKAAGIVNQYGLDGFVVDAESEFDAQPNANSNAVHLLTAYKQATGQPVGWCWWARFRSPLLRTSWHPVAVLKAAMDYADWGMPMCYWEGNGADQATKLLQQAWGQWREVTAKPIAPVGRAYVGDGGTATGPAVMAFATKARELAAAGICWWSMQHALAMPGVWTALAQTEPFGPVDGTSDLRVKLEDLRVQVRDLRERVEALERKAGV